MKRSLSVSIMIVSCLLVSLLQGCAANTKQLAFGQGEQPTSGGHAQTKRNFSGAMQYLMSGKEQQSRELLVKVVAAKPLHGVTDEALFQLALLNLRGDPLRARAHLDRLRKEFPDSVWARRAPPVIACLSSMKSVRDGQRDLRDINQQIESLKKENDELRNIIRKQNKVDI